MAKAKKKVAKSAAKKTVAKKPATKKPAVKAAAKKSVPKAGRAAPKAKASMGARPTTPKGQQSPPPALKAVGGKGFSSAKASGPKSRLLDVSEFLTPLDDRLVVQIQNTAGNKTTGGLYIPETVNQTTGNMQGCVVAVGRGRRDKKGRVRPMDVSPGDRILFPEYTGTKIDWQGEQLIILREGEVMGILST